MPDRNDQCNELAARILAQGACKKTVRQAKKYVQKQRLAESEAHWCFHDALNKGDMRELISRYTPKRAKHGSVCIDAVYGAMFGDIIGSKYEGKRIDMEDAEQAVQAAYAEPEQHVLTDDSVLTLATASAILSLKQTTDVRTKKGEYIGKSVSAFSDSYLQFGKKYPQAGYGPAFRWWLEAGERTPYGSNGNGAAMRISPVGAAGMPFRNVIKDAIASAACTHNHIEGIRGACVEAVCISMAAARKSNTKEQIFEYMRSVYSTPGENLFSRFTMEKAMGVRTHQIQCQFSVPAAIIAFHESVSFEDAISNALMAGSDTDTNACICGAVAGAYYGVSPAVKEFVRSKCDNI